MLRHDSAVTFAPIVLQAHDADARLCSELCRFRERHLALRLNQLGFEDTPHGFAVAFARGFAAGFRRAERFHVRVSDADFIERRGE